MRAWIGSPAVMVLLTLTIVIGLHHGQLGMQVVIEDKLGIGAELEAEMQRHADTYECEWKNAIEDPAIRRRFREFVNGEEVPA